MPPLQTSPVVQALPSSQEAVLSVCVQPVAGVAGVVGAAVAVVAVRAAAPPTQTPPLQVSAVVQALPSVQLVPFGLFGFEQMPVPGLQVPASWH